MHVLHFVHDRGPGLECDHLEDGDERVADVVEGDGVLEWVGGPLAALGEVGCVRVGHVEAGAHAGGWEGADEVVFFGRVEGGGVGSEAAVEEEAPPELDAYDAEAEEDEGAEEGDIAEHGQGVDDECDEDAHGGNTVDGAQGTEDADCADGCYAGIFWEV